MSHFDTPHNGYGSHPNPVMYFTEATWLSLEYIRDRCGALDINYERWFFNKRAGIIEDEALLETLTEGIIVYYPQYNCIRNGDHIETRDILSFKEFGDKLRKHPKHLGSMFIKSKTTDERDEIITYFEANNYRLHDIIKFDIELSLFINEPTKTLVVHSNRRADENEREGNYPVMTYEDFKIYMQ